MISKSYFRKQKFKIFFLFSFISVKQRKIFFLFRFFLPIEFTRKKKSGTRRKLQIVNGKKIKRRTRDPYCFLLSRPTSDPRCNEKRKKGVASDRYLLQQQQPVVLETGEDCSATAASGGACSGDLLYFRLLHFQRARRGKRRLEVAISGGWCYSSTQGARRVAGGVSGGG